MTETFAAWSNHLECCSVCRKTIRGRFAGRVPEQMMRQCCVVGRPLYENALAENRRNATAPAKEKA